MEKSVDFLSKFESEFRQLTLLFNMQSVIFDWGYKTPGFEAMERSTDFSSDFMKF